MVFENKLIQNLENRNSELQVKIEKLTKINFLYRDIIENKKFEKYRILNEFSSESDEILINSAVETLLREKEEKFQAIFDYAEDAILIADAQTGFIVDVNKSGEKLLGRLRNDILGMHQTELHPKKDENIVKSEFEKSKNYGKPDINEYDLVRADGTIIPVEITTSLMKIAGKPFILGFFRDISRRRVEELKLWESEKKFKYLFEANTDAIGIFRIKENGMPSKFIDSNNNSEFLLGYKKEEFLELSPIDIEIVESPDILQFRINEMITTGQCVFETKLIHKSGRQVDVEVKALVIEYQNESAIMNIARDITQRKEREIQLQMYIKELNQMNADKDKFMSILAHDLRNPFNSLLGFSEILCKEYETYEKDRLGFILKSINKTIVRTYSLLEDLLLWSYSQSGRLNFSPQKIFFEDVCNVIISGLQESADAKKINLNYFEPEKNIIMADLNMFKTILRNLVANAIKFTDIEGTVNISALKGNRSTIISVSDSGVGMKKEQIERLWDISIQNTTTGTAGEKGSGLGLLLCKEFVEKHGGSIEVYSEPGKGSTFTFTLPGI